jgi:N-acetylneuraminate lyase
MHRLDITGLVAATYTPLHGDGRLNLDAIGPLTEHLLTGGIAGLFVCGSTGEGMSLTSDERRQIAESYVKATAGRVPVIVHVGHNSLNDARELAAHAQQIGADAVSATSPSYYKPNSTSALVDSMGHIAAGSPELPFYYYDIPALTGVELDMIEFLGRGADRIPNLVGLKYTASRLDVFQQCGELDNGRFEVMWGLDEMLLGALAVGARAAVGSTYNIAAPVYRRLIQAFAQGDIEAARREQAFSIEMIHAIAQYPFHPAMKAVLHMLGHDCGACRLPQSSLSSENIQSLRDQLTAIGFFDAIGDGTSAAATPASAEVNG